MSEGWGGDRPQDDGVSAAPTALPGPTDPSPTVSAGGRVSTDAERARLYAEQMAEIPIVDGIIEGLTEELKRCRATVRGYRHASELRGSIGVWTKMRERMVAFAETVASAIADRNPEGGNAVGGAVHEGAGLKGIANIPLPPNPEQTEQ